MMKNRILAALLELRTQVQKGDYPVTGICNFVYHSDDYEITSYYLSRAIRKWPKFSGDATYPVPCDGITPKTAYDLHLSDIRRCRWLWESEEYGTVRRELLDFLIEHFKGMVDAGS